MTSTAQMAVDTNVFVHASMPDNEHFADAVSFFDSLLKTNLSLGVDPEFTLDTANNTSRVGAEYLRHISMLAPGTVGQAAFYSLATSGRFVEVSLRVPSGLHNKVKMLVKKEKPGDRTFLKVACMTSRKELVSHDFEDFPSHKRKQIRRELRVTICIASQWEP